MHSRKSSVDSIAPGQWRPGLKGARDFGKVEGAMRIGREEDLADGEAALSYDDLAGNLALPLPKAFPAGDAEATKFHPTDP